jgi:deoxyribodipyrimidine photo-lyase
MKRYALALHIFRRDLRLHDNTALNEALRLSDSVIPCFIFDTRQVEKQPYRSDKAIQFMVHSLQELNAALKEKDGKLYLFSGTAEAIIERLLQTKNIQAVFFNRDYTPFSRKRDQTIKKICDQAHVDLHVYADALLHEPEEILKTNGEPYTLFTPFFRKGSTLSVRAPEKLQPGHYYTQPIAFEDREKDSQLITTVYPHLLLQGGRKEGLKLIQQLSMLKDYQTIRNQPAQRGTTHLSAHHKFGTVSIRETYAAIESSFGRQHVLINELYWRDFFTHIAFHYPYVFGKAFHQKYNAISWANQPTTWEAWQSGKTGFPIVDAGMRELNATGYMHNRVRMIVASFLTKDLHIDWQKGEKYFAQQLIDYDPAVNNGNWQWAASTGCDAQPYFRIFNPWLQQQKFDPECVYIKRWVPELTGLSPKEIHRLAEREIAIPHYPRPIVDHATASQQAKKLYQAM